MQSRSNRLIPLIVIALFPSLRAHAAVTLLDKDDWKVMLGGFVEFDMLSDSTRSFTEVVGSSPVARPNTANGDNGRAQFSLRNSRFNFTLLPPVDREWKTRGFLEFDLLGFDPAPNAGGVAPNSESSFATNPTLRLRHAYFTAENNGFTILAGQTWTLFGWVPAYVPTTASVPPVTGTVYERTPQVTVIKSATLGEDSKFQAGLSVTRPVQRDSRTPGLDAGLRYSMGGRRAGYVAPGSDLKAEPMSVALSGTVREFVSPQAGGTTANQSHTLGSAFAVNAMIPILASSGEKDYGNTLALAGEYTRGKGYADQFTGWSGGVSQVNGTQNLDAGQGFTDVSGTFQLIKLQSWNAQLQYHLPSGMDSFVDLGFGQLRAMMDLSVLPLSAAAYYDRSEVVFANFFHDFNSHIRAALEVDHFTTRYTDDVKTQDNRVQVSTWFRF